MVAKKLRRAAEVAAWLVAAAALASLLVPGSTFWARLAARQGAATAGVVWLVVKDASPAGPSSPLHASAAAELGLALGAPRPGPGR